MIPPFAADAAQIAVRGNLTGRKRPGQVRRRSLRYRLLQTRRFQGRRVPRLPRPAGAGPGRPYMDYPASPLPTLAAVPDRRWIRSARCSATTDCSVGVEALVATCLSASTTGWPTWGSDRHL